jgi:hypothetical protein
VSAGLPTREQMVAAGVADTHAGFLANLDPAERADAERLAKARHAIALGDWDELTEHERAGSTIAALHYLRAARAIGLVPADGAR